MDFIELPQKKYFCISGDDAQVVFVVGTDSTLLFVNTENTCITVSMDSESKLNILNKTFDNINGKRFCFCHDILKS